MEQVFESTLEWPLPAVFPLIAGDVDDGDHPVPRPAKKKAPVKKKAPAKKAPAKKAAPKADKK